MNDTLLERREALARTRRDQRQRAIASNAALRDPQPTREVRDLLRELEARNTEAEKALAKKDHKARRLALAAVRSIQGRIDALFREQKDERWVSRAIAETTALEAARGGVVVPAKVGPMRIDNRDGLFSLLVAGRLADESDPPYATQIRYEAGSRYREGAEAAAVLGSQMGAIGTGGTGHNNDAFVRERLKLAKRARIVGQIDRAVAVRCHREHPSALATLRWVGIRGHALSALGEGRAFDRNLRALRAALDVADQVIREQE